MNWNPYSTNISTKDLSEAFLTEEVERELTEEEQKNLNEIKVKEKQNKFNFIVNEKTKITHDDVESQKLLSCKDKELKRLMPKDWRKTLEEHKKRQQLQWEKKYGEITANVSIRRVCDDK